MSEWRRYECHILWNWATDACDTWGSAGQLTTEDCHHGGSGWPTRLLVGWVIRVVSRLASHRPSRLTLRVLFQPSSLVSVLKCTACRGDGLTAGGRHPSCGASLPHRATSSERLHCAVIVGNKRLHRPPDPWLHRPSVLVAAFTHYIIGTFCFCSWRLSVGRQWLRRRRQAANYFRLSEWRAEPSMRRSTQKHIKRCASDFWMRRFTAGLHDWQTGQSIIAAESLVHPSPDNKIPFRTLTSLFGRRFSAFAVNIDR